MTRTSKRQAAKRNTKILQARKLRRRQWLTFMRMVRYGANNFTRNAWLTVAATAVMTITLLIIFMTIAAQNILNDSVNAISEKVDMSIYLKTETTQKQADKIIGELKELSNVRDASYISADQARDDNAKQNKSDSAVLDAIGEATNRLPATVRINLIDINDTSQLDDFVKNSKTVKPLLHADRKPSFAGERRDAIQGIARWTVMAQQIGLVASAIFVIISMLIVFNTIRMAIFSRKEEIQMMKLIGADKQFIRGPFVVEAIVYGFIAALCAAVIAYFVLLAVRDKFQGSGVDVQTTLDLVTVYAGPVVLGMIALGALIGTISSLLATRRYLKI